MSCSDPIETVVLADYWLAALRAPEEQAVEEHLFACDHCGSRLREVIALANGLRDLARQGSLRMVVSDAFLKRAAQEGLRLRVYAPPTGGGVDCTVTEEDDLLIARLAADLTGAARVDLCVCDEAGVEQRRLTDIPVQAVAGGVIYQESMVFAKAAPSGNLIVRLLAVEDAGGDRLLGEFTFRHTRSLPGPGAWLIT